MGRISILRHMSQERKKTLLEYIRAGADLEDACRAVGIASSTLRNWRTWAHQDPPKKPYAEFIDEVEQMEAQYAIETAAIINQLGKGRAKGAKDAKGNPLPAYDLHPDWKALAWGLSKRFPKKWGDTQKLEVSGSLAQAEATPAMAAALVRKKFGEHAAKPSGVAAGAQALGEADSVSGSSSDK